MAPLRKTLFSMVPKLLWNHIWILYNQRCIFLRFLNPKLCQIQIQLQKRLFPRKKKLNFIQLRIEKIQNNLLCKLYRIQMGLHNNFGFIIYCAFLARFFFANLLKKSHIFSYTTWAMRSSENGSCIQYVAQSSLAAMPDT